MHVEPVVPVVVGVHAACTVVVVGSGGDKGRAVPAVLTGGQVHERSVKHDSLAFPVAAAVAVVVAVLLQAVRVGSAAVGAQATGTGAFAGVGGRGVTNTGREGVFEVHFVGVAGGIRQRQVVEDVPEVRSVVVLVRPVVVDGRHGERLVSRQGEGTDRATSTAVDLLRSKRQVVGHTVGVRDRLTGDATGGVLQHNGGPDHIVGTARGVGVDVDVQLSQTGQFARARDFNRRGVDVPFNEVNVRCTGDHHVLGVG